MKKIVVIVSIIAAVVLFAILVTYKVYDEGKFDFKKISTCTTCNNIETELRRIPIRTCNGEGELYLFETDNPFAPIQTAFEIERNQLLVFKSKEALVQVKADGQTVNLENLSFTDSRVLMAKNVDKGSEISISGEYSYGIRGLQGFIAQDSTRPVYDINTFKYIYQDSTSSVMFLTPGSYSYVFFDKYSLKGPGQGADTRKLSVKVEGPDGVILEKTFTQPAPGGTEGAVVGNYSVNQQGNYTMSVDSEDSIYYALVKCPVCGDGKKEKGEDCDDGENNGKICDADYGDDCFYCSENCEYVTKEGPYCGDGKTDQGYEECDEGQDNGIPCSPAYGASCTYCTSSCEKETVSGSSCGDGKLDQGEACDDGNNLDNDGCNSDCQLPENCNERCIETIGCGGGFSCEGGFCRNSACSEETDCVCATCGDGKLDPTEECDDGNSISGDGCNVDCTKPDSCNDVCVSSIGCSGGLGCSGGVCRNTLCPLEFDCICESCGDGKLDPGEQCDDGNNKNGDGCSSLCRNEKNDEEEDEEDHGDCSGSIGNYVWNDANGDGVQDPEEKGLKKIGMKLTWAGPDDEFGNSDDEVFRDDTDSEGRYEFKDLCKGDYRVRVKDTDVSGYIQTYDPDGKKDHKTDVRLKKDNDEHTKADFGYRALKVAPASGLGLTVILLISFALTIIVLTGLFLRNRLNRVG